MYLHLPPKLPKCIKKKTMRWVPQISNSVFSFVMNSLNPHGGMGKDVLYIQPREGTCKLTQILGFSYKDLGKQ